MGIINPMFPRGPIQVTGSVKAEGASRSKATAAKVAQIKLPIIEQKTDLQNRQIVVLKDASELSKKIKSDWNALAPEELAEKIIELENKVSLLKGTSPAIEKIKKQAEHLHFQFVFPIVLEIDTAPLESSMPVSFAREIYNMANKIFKTNSVQAFKELNPTQRQEVMRYALGSIS